MTKMDDFTLQDYPGFAHNQHWYSVATAGGDRWQAIWPIASAIEQNKLDAIDTCSTQAEIDKILATSNSDWIDYLAVFDRDDNELAEWRNGEWYHNYAQAAALLNAHYQTVRGWVKDGKLGTHYGTGYLITAADIAAFTPPKAGRPYDGTAHREGGRFAKTPAKPEKG